MKLSDQMLVCVDWWIFGNAFQSYFFHKNTLISYKNTNLKMLFAKWWPFCRYSKCVGIFIIKQVWCPFPGKPHWQIRLLLIICCPPAALSSIGFFVRRAGLLWSQQDFEWRWSVPLFKCLTVLEFSFILFDLCLLITFFNFIMNYVPIVTFWIFTYHKIWILSIMFCSIWSYWSIYFLACLEVSWRVVS